MNKAVQNTLLGVIATCLVLITARLYIPEAKANDSHVIERILYCIDGGSIQLSGDSDSLSGSFTTYCDG